MMQLQREIRLEVPMAQEPAGMIRLGVSESLCYNRLPQILLKYRRRFPAVDFQLSFIMHDTFAAQLKKGILDIAYSLDPPMEYPDLAILCERPETLGFYVNPAHPLAKKKAVAERDLEGIPLLVTSHTCTFRQMLLEDLAGESVAPRIALETSSKEILKQFAINELGVAFMPDMAVREEIKQGLLKRLEWAGHDFPVCSRVYIHKDKHKNKAIRELVNIIEKSI
jgi:DNA-binding transcriptional LysR family regulator